jgi:hypothetical protein
MKKHPKNCPCSICTDKKNLREDMKMVGLDMKRALAIYKGETPEEYPKDRWVESREKNIHPWLIKSRAFREQGTRFKAFWWAFLYGFRYSAQNF